MQETIFQPKYTIRGNWDVLSISLLMIITLLFSFLKFGISLSNILGLIFLVYFIVSFSPLYVYRIVFTPSSFIVERYIWPSKKIEYSDVVDVGISKVKTRNGNVSFAGMSNAAQLHSLFTELIEQGRIGKHQLENKISVEEMILHKTILPSIVAISVLAGALFIFWPYHNSWISDLGIVFSLIFIVYIVITVIYWINKRRSKNH